MTYEEATAKVSELKARFDSPFDATDKEVIETLYFEVTRKRFVPTTCQQCYHDALIEIYLKLKTDSETSSSRIRFSVHFFFDS